MGSQNALSNEPIVVTEAPQTATEVAALKTEAGDVSGGLLLEQGVHDRRTYRRFLKDKTTWKSLVGQTGALPDTMTVDLPSKQEEESIGLAETMDETVEEVHVTGTHNGKTYDLVGKREANGLFGSFFTDDHRYVPIHSGFTVQITKRRDEKAIAEIREAMKNKHRDYADMEYLKGYRDPKNPKEFDMILQVGIEQGIDPSVLFALKTVAGQEGRAFGLYDAGGETFAGQLVLAAHRMSKALHAYQSAGKESPMKYDHRYSADFMAFAIQGYDVLPGHDDAFVPKETVQKLLKEYNKASGGTLYSEDEMGKATENQAPILDRDTADRGFGNVVPAATTIRALGGWREAIERQLVYTRFLGKEVRVHEKMAIKLNAAQKDIQALSENNPQVKLWINSIEQMSGYQWRQRAGGGGMSNHAWGGAIDIDPKLNVYRAEGIGESNRYDPRYNQIPREVVEKMKDHGFRWGGDWERPYDAMHFDLGTKETLNSMGVNV